MTGKVDRFMTAISEAGFGWVSIGWVDVGWVGSGPVADNYLHEEDNAGEEDDIDALLAASSFGSEQARAIREQTPPAAREHARRVLDGKEKCAPADGDVDDAVGGLVYGLAHGVVPGPTVWILAGSALTPGDLLTAWSGLGQADLKLVIFTACQTSVLWPDHRARLLQALIDHDAFVSLRHDVAWKIIDWTFDLPRPPRVLRQCAALAVEQIDFAAIAHTWLASTRDEAATRSCEPRPSYLHMSGAVAVQDVHLQQETPPERSGGLVPTTPALDSAPPCAALTAGPTRPAIAAPTGATGPEEHWQPALTPKEAAKLGIPKKEYESAALFARMAVEEHQRLGTARDRWEPTLIQNDHLAGPFITDGEQELARRLEAEADPALDKAQRLIENVKANLDKITEGTRPIAAPESCANYSAAQAAERIEQDEAVGMHHHHRASALLRRLASWAPWVEAAGFLTFIAYYLNVPMLQPWQDWLGWSFAVTAVVAITRGQTWLVRHAARSHNHAREARADRNRYEAEQGFTRRDRYIGLTAVTAAAITSGMIWRGTGAHGDASVGATAVMVFVAAVIGLLLPTLAFLGVALDGSRVSRERDSLAADLDGDLDAYLEAISNSRRDLAAAAEIGDTLKDKTFPDICHTTQEAVDAIYGFYGTVRLLIGGLSAAPPPQTTKTSGKDTEGNIRGYIGTSIPGTRKVNLDPLFDRWQRLAELESQRTDFLDRINAFTPLPPERAGGLVPAKTALDSAPGGTALTAGRRVGQENVVCTRRTRVRRGVQPRRRRSNRSRGRARIRHQPPRRRSASTRRSAYTRHRPYGRGARAPRLSLSKSLKTAIMASALVTAIVAVVAVLAGGFPGVQHVRPTGVIGPAGADTGTVAGQFIYTTRAANDVAITLPGVVQDELRQAGLAHQSIELTRVDYTGTVSTSYIDMTPRTGNSSNDPVLKVTARTVSVIDAKISALEQTINSPAATTGGRALYVGLTKTDFTGVPVTIISSSIDLARPDDFRSLKWTVPPGEVVADVKKSGALPALHGPVTFVSVPAAGPQLKQAQKNLKAVWTALLKAAGATSVTFIGAADPPAG